MLPEDAHKILALLRPMGASIAEISSIPGLCETDFVLLHYLAGNTMLLARRMEARTQGLDLAPVPEAGQEAARLTFAEVSTERVQ